jgi:glycosyltransferase involved in cell wall biosynthesis
VTKGIKNELIRRYGVSTNRISIVTNGVDLERFRPINRAKAQQKTRLSPLYNYVGFVGGLFPWHGLDHLVEAAPHVLKKEPQTWFVIVGSGLMEVRLKKMVAKRKLDQAFIFTGMVPFDAVPMYVNSFDVCIVFFKRVRKDPGDPIKLYEYLACGRPVVASNVPGYGDVVGSIGAGISINSEDPIATSEAIVRLLKNRRKAEEMGRKGFAKAQVCFSWAKKVDETERIMMEVLKI